MPELPDLLRADEPFVLPQGLDLRLAVGVGRRARVTGGISGFYLYGPIVGGLPLGNTALAQCHYAPVAWQLVFDDGAALSDREGWASIAHWFCIDATTEVPLNLACGPLPMVLQPRHRREIGHLWIELLGGDVCFVLESDNIAPPAG